MGSSKRGAGYRLAMSRLLLLEAPEVAPAPPPVAPALRIVDLRQIYGSRPYPPRPLSWILYVNVHHAQGRMPANEADAIKVIAEIDAFHRGPERNWPGFAYHGGIWHDTLFLVRPFDRQGWHTGGMDENGNGIGDGNDLGIAFVLLGTYTSSTPSARTIQTLGQACVYAEGQVGRKLVITGHQEWTGTECPSRNWTQWRDDVVAARDRARASG